MNWNPRDHSIRAVLLSAALIAILVGCRSDPEPAPVAPAPVVFVPTSVVVTLGGSGGATTLISTQAGGWTRNGEPFSSGQTASGENGAAYRLTLANNTWSAEFVPPAAARVQLGTSGDTVAVNAREDGSFALDGAQLQSGQVVSAANGNRYALVLGARDIWTAEFVPPAAARVQLGTSGDTVAVNAREDGSFALDGAQLQSGQVVSAANGNRYALVLGARDIWTAEFVPPAAARVQLGTSGDTVAVNAREDGSFALDGAQLQSGQVVSAANGNRYALVLGARDIWTAEFVPPAAARVQLGISGDTVAVNAREDGSFALDGAQLQSGQVVSAANGNRYALVLGARDIWTAEFVPPAPLRIPLGTSGDVAIVEMRENRTYWIEGMQLQSGQLVRAANGNRYALSLGADGVWMPLFVAPDPQVVVLGASGLTVAIDELEDGSFRFAGLALGSGQVRTVKGLDYRFSLDANGSWSAVYAPQPTLVRLGAHGGSIQLVRQENGQWLLDGELVGTGRIVKGSNDHNYRLIYSAAAWHAEPQPISLQVSLGAGGSIILTRLEDGSYWYEGSQVASGDEVSVRGTSYRLTLAAGEVWRAARASDPPTGGGGGGTPPTTDSLSAYVGATPRIELTTPDGTDTRSGSILKVNGAEYSLTDLFANGEVNREVTFAEDAHDRIAAELSDIETLLDISQTTSGFDSVIELRWDRVARHLESIFPGEGAKLLGANAPKERDGDIDADEVVEEIRDVLAALSSVSAFEAAVDDGIFSGTTKVGVNDSDDVYSTVKSVSRLSFDWTDSTRYGAYSKRERSTISSALRLGTGSAGIGAFAYSPLTTTRTRDLPGSGEALYIGETVAASGDSTQAVYRGAIELRVRLGSRLVSGVVTDLLDDQGRAWRYSSADVATITLPTATLSTGLASFDISGSGRASIAYSRLAGSPSTRTVNSEFEGRLVGRGVDSGAAAMGTWSLRGSGSTLLAGAFGAESELNPATPTPVPVPVAPDSGDSGEESETFLVAQPDSGGDIEIAALDTKGNKIELPAADLYANGGMFQAGKRLFELAQDQLNRQLEVLDIYINVIELGGSEGLQSRQTAWDKANTALDDHVFGSRRVLGNSYPAGTTLDDRDEDAVALLREAVDALASPERFRSSLEDGEVFENLLSQSRLEAGEYDFEDMFDALGYSVTAEYGHTLYGRFGAWAKTVRSDALSSARTATSAERPDVFAYSPIGQTVYSTNDLNFPSNITSTYNGATVAVSDNSAEPRFYEGTVRLTVQWGSRAPGSAVYTSIEELARVDTGELFLNEGFEVDEIIFGRTSVTVDSDGRVGFRGTSSVRVGYVDVFRAERRYGSGLVEGKFVGYNVAGPLGVIATWEVEDLKGALGADLVP